MIGTKHGSALKTAMILIITSAWLDAAHAVDRGLITPQSDVVEAYEPSTLGYTHDSDDVPFMDFRCR
jgi:hypothetical protein